MNLLQLFRAILRRNADPIACACKVFTKQIAALNAHVETQRKAIEASVIKIAKEKEALEVSLSEIDRANRIKSNIENIIGEAA